MKKIIYFLSISFLLLQSCTSDSNNDSETSSVLCKTIKFNKASGDINREEFTYNGNKFSQVSSYNNNVFESKTIIYYKGNLISEVKNYNKDNKLDYTTTFSYDSSGKIISRLSIDSDPNSNDSSKTIYRYNQDGTITELVYSGNQTIQDGLEVTTTYTLLDNLIIKAEVVNGNYPARTQTYKYDTKNGPFKNVAGFDWYFTGDNFYGGFKHNIIEDTDSNYNYTFNSANYPILRTSSQNEDTVEYIY
jgi:hypothetical protein